MSWFCQNVSTWNWWRLFIWRQAKTTTLTSDQIESHSEIFPCHCSVSPFVLISSKGPIQINRADAAVSMGLPLYPAVEGSGALLEREEHERLALGTPGSVPRPFTTHWHAPHHVRLHLELFGQGAPNKAHHLKSRAPPIPEVHQMVGLWQGGNHGDDLK